MDLFKTRRQLDLGKTIFDLSLRVVYYARVSTDRDEQINSLENQITYYDTYIKSNENWAFCGGYVDEGLSGTSVGKREQFLQMIK
jgi:DNA invertase Pin-like site-specific DNA recombinase